MKKHLAPLAIALGLGIASSTASAMEVWIGGSVGSALNQTNVRDGGDDPNTCGSGSYVNDFSPESFCDSINFTNDKRSYPLNIELGIQAPKINMFAFGARAGLQFNNPSSVKDYGSNFNPSFAFVEHGAEIGGFGYGLIDLSVFVNESTQIGVGVGAGFGEVNYVFKDPGNFGSNFNASSKSYEPNLMTEVFMRTRIHKNVSVNVAYTNNRFQSKTLETTVDNGVEFSTNYETTIKPKLSTFRVGLNYHF